MRRQRSRTPRILPQMNDVMDAEKGHERRCGSLNKRYTECDKKSSPPSCSRLDKGVLYVATGLHRK